MTHEPHASGAMPSINALGVEFARVAAEQGRDPSKLWDSTRRRAIAAVACAALVGFTLTPPGQAIAERVGEFIGLVDHGSVVIGLGETPQEQHPYRVTASGEHAPGETCLFLQFTEVGDSGMGSCLAGPVPADLAAGSLSPLVYSPPPGLMPSGSAVLQGLATPNVSRVEVSYATDGDEDASVSVDLADLDSNLLSKVELADDPVRFFVAFLPPEAVQGGTGADRVSGVTIRAFDSSGDQVATRSLSHLADYESGFSATD